MNKFSIATINLKNLDGEVDKFEIKHNKDAYIFMNKDTANALMFEIEYKTLKASNFLYSGVICKYKGNKVFIDNELKYGEIELR